MNQDEPQAPNESTEGQKTEVLEAEVSTLVQTALTTYDPLAKEIVELKECVENTVYDLTKTKDNKEARRVRASIKAIPGKIDAAYDSWNRPRLTAAEKMRERRDQLKEMVPGILAPIDEQITADEKRREDERVENERVENERVAAIRKKITGLMSLPVTLANASSETIDKTIVYISQQTLTKDVYAEFLEEAQGVVKQLLESLPILRDGAKAREDQAVELERLRVENDERMKREQKEREERAAADKLAEEQRQEDARKSAAAAQKLIDDAKAADEEKLAQAKLVAEEQQALLKRQTDAFEEERKVANAVGLIQGAVTRAASKDTSQEIEEIIIEVGKYEVFGSTPELEKQIIDAKVEITKALNRMLDRVRGSEQPDPPAPVESSATLELPPESEPEPANADAAMQDALIEANAASGGDQLSPEELAMQTVHEVGAEETPPARIWTSVTRVSAPAAAPAEPPADLKSEVEHVIAAKRPTDAIILHTLATTFGVSEREALEWLEDLDLFELQKTVDAS